MPPLTPTVCFILVVSLGLLAASIGMMVWHVRAWRTIQQQQLAADEFTYRRRQFRRRIQISAMLGLLAIALSAGHFLVFWMHSNWFELAYWTVTLLVACWLGLLALADMSATRQHFARQEDRNLLEQVKLDAEARRLAAETGEGNGKPAK
jgi:hypothetical protein